MRGGNGVPIKDIIIFVIFIVFLLPSLINLVSFTFKSTTSSPEKVAEDGAKLIAEEAAPWWVGLIDWLAKLPSQIAAFFILGFVFLLLWIGPFK
jgi:hypothetical protein